MSDKMKQCKACGTELYKGAKICPKCGKKQGGKVKFIVLAVVVIAIIASIAASGSGDSSNSSDAGKKTENITYTSYDLADMFDELDSNAMVAEETYTDAYVEISGKISNIDSDGSYISIEPDDGDFYFIGMQCYLSNDEQRDVVKTKSTGEMVTIKGQITEVGEIMGYSLDIDSIE